MKKITKMFLMVMMVVTLMAGSSMAASVSADLTKSQTQAYSGYLSAKGVYITGSNSATSSYSVRIFSQYIAKDGSIANDVSARVAVGGICSRTDSFKFSNNKSWRVFIKPNSFNATGCSATAKITGR